ncbi:dnaJ homolog subfamily B member 14-like [Linepithema humile]|uniref:dnaJ homolog subfamily B member 14-like n=1 Tax=Linepithema humile TaxID=83485 RepID=UPI00351E87D7
MNYYEVLGCNKHSTHEEIKRAYHQRLLRFHPDKNDTANANEFHNVKEAWRILGCPQSRKQYDATCKQEELENEDSLIYARLSPSDLEAPAFEDTLFYRCRCGDRYLVERKDLQEKNTILEITCDSCTLVIIIET